MKNIVYATTALLILLNIICGLVIPEYEVFNIVMTSIIIIVNMVLVIVALNILNDAFKISLSFLDTFFCVVECALSALSPQEIEANYYIIGICSMLILQLIILISARYCQR